MKENIEAQYLKLVDNIIKNGKLIPNRTGISAYTLCHAMLTHDFKDGFPLMTTKRVPMKLVAVELEGFIKGITDKKWFQDRGCEIWSDWANPQKVKYGTDEESKLNMRKERDLGKIYGYQWKNFNSEGYDQLKTVIETINNNKKNGIHDRRMIVSAWNPLQLNEMALPPCHILYHVSIHGDFLNLCWFQRSCDMMLGVPFNISSYALLTVLIAKETGFKPGILTGFLSDVHIYENHIENAKIQIQRKPYKFPTLNPGEFTTILSNDDEDGWDHTKIKVENYQHHPDLKYDIAV